MEWERLIIDGDKVKEWMKQRTEHYEKQVGDYSVGYIEACEEFLELMSEDKFKPDNNYAKIIYKGYQKHIIDTSRMN